MRTYSSLVRDLLREMVPLKFPEVLEIPNVVVVVVALLAPDEGVVQALCDSFAGPHATRDIRYSLVRRKGMFDDRVGAHYVRRSYNTTLQLQQ